jgi:hypothetical protein
MHTPIIPFLEKVWVVFKIVALSISDKCDC